MSIQPVTTRRKPVSNLTFEVERRPDFLVVAIKGEASFDQAEIIFKLLQVPLGSYWLVVVNLAGLTFMNSVALDDLITYRRGLCRRGVEVRLANVPAHVWLALESAGLGKLFETIDLEEPTRAPAPRMLQA